jgi:dethiobiotin synthetase
MSNCRMIFITGTDTGVGKTVLTSLLLARLRGEGAKALAVKPFCSGNRTDPTLLRALQDNELSIEEVNPFFFPEPVAPLVASRKHRRSIPLETVLDRIQSIAARCDCLLIEGAGGLLVPLGEGYSVLDLVVRLKSEVVVVSRNRLGTLNHTMLTVRELARSRVRRVKVVMMQSGREDFATRSNLEILPQLLAPTPLFLIPFLGRRACQTSVIRESAERYSAILRRILR